MRNIRGHSTPVAKDYTNISYGEISGHLSSKSFFVSEIISVVHMLKDKL